MMNKTKLISILKSFSKPEMSKFSFFVRVFYAAGNGKILKLLREIVKYYPKFENENFTKELLFKKVYNQKKYNDATMRKLISYLTAVVEEFLIYISVKKDAFASDLHLLKELSSRNLDRIFQQQAAITEKQMKRYARNSEYYYNRFRLLNTVNSFHAIRKRSIAVDNYQKEADSFFHYFFIEALNTYIYLANEKKISNREFHLPLFTEVMNHLKNNSYSEIISIPVYYNCLMLIMSEDEKYFHMLRELQKKLDYKINNDELRATYIVFENFCVAQENKGIAEYKKDMFELQKESVLRGLHLSGERIHIFTFLNIVTQAVSAGELLWAENFIKQNGHLLEPEYEFDVVNLAYAKCEFSRKEFEKALTNLGKINIESSHFKLSVRTLMLMIYYELGLYEPAVSLLDTYKHFIARDKLLPKPDKQNRMEFAKYFKEILSLKAGMSRDIHTIQHQVLTSDYFAEKEWFLEKIDELEV